MKIGITIHSLTPHVAALAKEAEESGYSSVWCAEMPTAQGDVFACMAVAATVTERIGIGSLVTTAATRTPLATANGALTINALAPGRTYIGFGNGTFARNLAGQPFLPFSTFRAHLQTLCQLVREGEADVEAGEGKTSRARFVYRDENYLRLEPRVPIYPVSNGPRGLRLAGELGDGLAGASIPDIDYVASLYRTAVEARGSAENFPFVYDTPVCLLRDDETLESPRVVEHTGQFVAMMIKLSAAGVYPQSALPAALRPQAEKYVKRLATLSAQERHMKLWSTPYTLAPDERELVTPEAIRAVAIVGDRTDVIGHIKELEKVGVTELLMDINVAIPFDVLRDCAEDIVGRV